MRIPFTGGVELTTRPPDSRSSRETGSLRKMLRRFDVPTAPSFPSSTRTMFN